MTNPLSDHGISSEEYVEVVSDVQKQFFTAGVHPSVVALRDRVQDLAAAIVLLVPAGRQRSLALTALEDVQMRANRGLFAAPEKQHKTYATPITKES